MRKTAFLLLLILGAFAPRILHAQPASSSPTLRYHFGDNPAWAAPDLDDGAWQVSRTGTVPLPGYQSDGYFWVRARIAVPAGETGPLAIEAQTRDMFQEYVQELWINGRLVGRYGDFPPHARPLIPPQLLVFDIPAGLVQPGSTAEIALRTWNAPSDSSESLVLHRPDPAHVQFTIAAAPLLHALAAQAQDRAWLIYWPQLMVMILFIMLGLAVLSLGIWAHDRTLLLCALWLVALPMFLAFGPLTYLLVGTPAAEVLTAFLIVNAIGMCIVLEFTWAVQAFPDRIFRTVAHLCWIGLTVSGIYLAVQMHPGVPNTVGMLTGNWLLFLFNLIGIGAILLALAGRGRNRAIAAAMLVTGIGYFLRLAGYRFNLTWHGITIFWVGFVLSTLVIAALVLRQAWTSWRNAEDLKVQFAAARELQEQLVPMALPPLAGWRMEAAYQPATEVGGDFYHLIERHDATLLLIGDVSGKGLKAAMTGVLTLGAASALASDCPDPAQLLTRLNREIARLQKPGGFVTCLCIRMGSDGALTLANAGHLAPYHNGEEIPLDSGLPLGLIAEVEYSQRTIQLEAGDQLTFLSDGVVEAQSSTGELFGFDRTREISTRTASEIARTAQAFGQEDDITVLTLTREAVTEAKTESITIPLAASPSPA